MSGIYTYVSLVLSSVIGDPSQNNWFGGEPSAPITYPNGPTSTPELGAPLRGEPATRANELMAYYKARIYWLGNEQLAAKYGTTTPEALTPVEQEMWSRQVAVIQYAVARITEVVAIPPPAPPAPLLRKAPDAKQETPSRESLADRYQIASADERAELLKAILIGREPL